MHNTARELLHAKPEKSTVFPVWPKVGENHSVKFKEFPSRGQQGKVGRGQRRHWINRDRLLVYDRRVQVLPSRAKRGTSLCEEQLGSRPDSLLASYLVGFTLKTLIFKFSVTIGIFS